MITNLDYYFSLKKFNDFCKGNQCFLKSHLEAHEECSRTSLVTHCNSMSRYKLSSQSKHFSQWEVTFRTLYVCYGGAGLPLQGMKIRCCRYFTVRSHYSPRQHWAPPLHGSGELQTHPQNSSQALSVLYYLVQTIRRTWFCERAIPKSYRKHFCKAPVHYSHGVSPSHGF